ncbi:MAG: hypothetical protein ACXAEU_20585 [Candidatus Hodarchaeales archaeon]|jgi:hypothetical protein
MYKVIETVKQQLLASYLWLMLNDGEVVKIAYFDGLRSFYYMKTEHSKSTSNLSG